MDYPENILYYCHVYIGWSTPSCSGYVYSVYMATKLTSHSIHS